MNRFFLTRDRFVNSLNVLGPRFLICIVLVEHLLQGFIFGSGTQGIVGSPIVFMMKAYGVLTASRIQVLRTIAFSPWSLKPILGIISDCLYIGGFNKIPYIIVTTIGAIVSCLFIAFTWPLSPNTLTVLLFFLFLQISTADLLMEAKYTEKITEYDESRVNDPEKKDISSDLVTFNNTGVGFGSLIASIVVGVLIDIVPYQFLYLIPIFPFLSLLYPIYHNWIDDREYDGDGDNLVSVFGKRWYYSKKDGTEGNEIPLVGIDFIKIRGNWRIMMLGMIIVFMASVSIIIGFLGVPSLYLFLFSTLSSLLLIGAFFLLAERNIALLQTYIMIQNMCSFSLEGAEFFFFTDSATSYPEGPHFSNLFYITVLGVVATLLSVAGMFIYNFYMTEWSFRSILLFTNLVYVLISFTNVILYKRLNVAMGIPNELFVLGTEVIRVIIGNWGYAAFSVIMLKICPKGVGATSYALLAGCANLGNSFSQYQGAFLLDVLGIKPMGAVAESAQFKNLWIASLISICISFLPVLTIPWLIPSGSPNDSSKAAEEVVAESPPPTLVINKE
jgi:hypothetical protein